MLAAGSKPVGSQCCVAIELLVGLGEPAADTRWRCWATFSQIIPTGESAPQKTSGMEQDNGYGFKVNVRTASRPQRDKKGQNA